MCALRRNAKDRQGKLLRPLLTQEDGSGLGLGMVDGTKGAWDNCFEWRREQIGAGLFCVAVHCLVLGLSFEKLHTAALPLFD